MTQDELIEMAKQVGIIAKGDEWVFDISNALALTVNQKQLERFAKLVAEKAISETEKDEPVAWINTKTLEAMHSDPRFNLVQQMCSLTVDKVFDEQTPLYTSPQPRKE